MQIRYERAAYLRPATESCPFCSAGSESASVTEVRHFTGTEARTLLQITCRCGASGPPRSSLVDATAAWNGAADHQRQGARLAS